jgi:hypothetical protein
MEEVKIGSEFTAFKRYTPQSLEKEGESCDSLEKLAQLASDVKVSPGNVISVDSSEDCPNEEVENRSEGQMTMETIYEHAKAAVNRVQRTKTMLQEYFQSFDQSALNAYQLERITALLNEANIIGSVEINPNQANAFDFIRIVRCCSRQVDWLLQILEECQSIITKESTPEYC